MRVGDFAPQQFRDLSERRRGREDDGITGMGEQEPQESPRRGEGLRGVMARGDECLFVVADRLQNLLLLVEERPLTEGRCDELPGV